MSKPFVNIFSKPLLLHTIIYLVLSVILLPWYRYQINPDGISYIGIAYKYSQLNFPSAINGYWGPFISWLLAPLLYLTDDSLLAFRILSILIGLLTLLQAHLLIRKFFFIPFIEFVMSLSIVVIVLNYSLTFITSDLLFLFFALLLINRLINLQEKFSNRNAVLAGITGACLYLTKSYGFYLVAGSYFILFLTWYFFQTDKALQKKILKTVLITYSVFLCISACWIIVISYKYGYLSVGTAGTYNHRIFGPHSPGSPLYYAGLMDPIDKTATSVREDLSYVKIKDWNVFGSKEELFHQWYLIKVNGYMLIDVLLQFSYLSFLIMAVIFFFIIRNWKKTIKSKIFPVIVLMTILPIGYLLLILMDRYVWLCNISLLLTGTYVIKEMMSRTKKTFLVKILLQTLIILSFTISPIKNLIARKDNGKDFFLLSKKLKEYNIKGKVASQGYWMGSLYLSFYTHSQYYGECRSKDEAGIIKELTEKKINYYIVWSKGKNNMIITNRILLHFPEITGGKLKDLLIYKIF